MDTFVLLFCQPLQARVFTVDRLGQWCANNPCASAFLETSTGLHHSISCLQGHAPVLVLMLRLAAAYRQLLTAWKQVQAISQHEPQCMAPHDKDNCAIDSGQQAGKDFHA